MVNRCPADPDQYASPEVHNVAQFFVLFCDLMLVTDTHTIQGWFIERNTNLLREEVNDHKNPISIIPE